MELSCEMATREWNKKVYVDEKMDVAMDLYATRGRNTGKSLRQPAFTCVSRARKYKKV
jgi:hypothetical protein